MLVLKKEEDHEYMTDHFRFPYMGARKDVAPVEVLGKLMELFLGPWHGRSFAMAGGPDQCDPGPLLGGNLESRTPW